MTILEEIANQDYPHIAQSIESFISKRVHAAKKDGVILGLSGGIDSAVSTTLAKRCIPHTLVMIMPDSKISPKQETQDALDLVESMNLDYKILDINPIVNEFAKTLEPDQRALGNLRARVRTSILYYYANIRNYLVIGSSDKSEYLIGYFTKYGDGAADILPLTSLYKTQVRGLARHLNIFPKIIDKKSSPNLWPNHDAESEIGATYDQIDCILYCMIDKKYDIYKTESLLNIPKQTIDKIHQMYIESQHKREQPVHAEVI